MLDSDNHTLFQAFQQGERWAEKAIFDQFFRPLTLYAERITGSWTAAEDIATDAIVKGVQRRAEFTNLRSLKAFFYRLAHNAGVNERIRVGRHSAIHERIRREAPAEGDPGDQVDNRILRAELLAEIYAEVDKLPGRCGEIFRLIFLEDLDNETIAARMGINVQTVRSQKARAIGIIRTALLKKGRMATLLFFYACLQLHS